MKNKMWPIVALAAAVLVIPQIALAAAGSFSSGSASVAAVSGTNSSTGSAAKGVYGYASGSSAVNYGVIGKTNSSTGYGVYSSGNLGIKAGKLLKCTGCVTLADMGFDPATQSELDAAVQGAATSVENYSGTIGSSCTNFGSITISVPGSGTVMLMANPHVYLNHTNGSTDGAVTGWGTTSSDCDFSDANGLYTQSGVYQVPSAAPTASGYYTTISTMATFTPGAGSVTYYLNAYMENGADAGDILLRSQLFAQYLG